MLAVGERVPVVVDVVVGEFDGGAGGALPGDDRCELPGEAMGKLRGLGWGGGVDRDGVTTRIGTVGLKGGTKKQEKATASARVRGVER